MYRKSCPKNRDREPPKTSKEKIFKFETVDSLDSLSQADVGYNWPDSPVKITIGGKKIMQQKSMQLKVNSPSNVKRFLSSPVLRATSSYIDFDKQKNRGFHKFQEEIKNEQLKISKSNSNYYTANDDSLLHSPKDHDSDEESVESFKFDSSDFDDPLEIAINKPKSVKDMYEGLDDSYNDKLLANLPMDEIIRRCTQSELKIVQVEIHISPELTKSKIVATANSKLPKHTSMPSTSITNNQLPTSTVITKISDAINKPANKLQFERHASMPFGKKGPTPKALSSNLKISQSKESISLSGSSTSIQSSSSSSPPKCTPQEIAEKREKALITRKIRENEAKARQIRDSRMKQVNK